MKSIPKWLVIPPAAAAVLVLGPLSMRSQVTPNEVNAQERRATTPADDGADQGADQGADTNPDGLGSLVPRMPDMWRIAAAGCAVLLLGAGTLLMLRRLRGPTPMTGGSKPATLRQTLRLSQRQALHAVEFDDRILLVGENDRGLTLIDRGRLPESAIDEAEVTRRTVSQPATDEAGADEGAVPKDLLIPRPGRTRRRPQQDKASAVLSGAEQKLSDFRALLQKAGL